MELHGVNARAVIALSFLTLTIVPLRALTSLLKTDLDSLSSFRLNVVGNASWIDLPRKNAMSLGYSGNRPLPENRSTHTNLYCLLISLFTFPMHFDCLTHYEDSLGLLQALFADHAGGGGRLRLPDL